MFGVDKAPISVCMIVRNESAQLESCLKSIRPYVDEICIVDTGSNDSTPDIAQKYSDKFERYDGCNDDQGRILDFSDARQKSFSLATNDWVMWVDGDDEVRGMENISSLISSYQNSSNPIQIMFPYEYSHDSEGKVNCLHYRERLMFPRSAFAWQNAVHEVITCKTSASQIQSDLVTVVHRRDGSGKPIESGRNLRILKAMYEKHGETDARHLYYLGLEYGNNNDRDNALKFLKRYIELSGWDDEKYMACLKIVDHYMSMAAYDNAISWCMKAVSINEKWGEAYFQMAKCYYFLAKNDKDSYRNWERCAHFAKHGLSLPPTKTVLFVNPGERDLEIHKYLNVALNSIWDVKGALDSVMKGLESSPGESSLEFNRKIYYKFLAMNEVRSGLDKLKKEKLVNDDSIESIISIIEGKQQNSNKSTLVQNITKGSGLNITVYVGQGIESWNPNTAKESGIGGSETAVIEMTSRLAKIGHNVTVYGHCINSFGKSIEGVFDNVSYHDSSFYGPHDCDVLITSRRPEAVDYGVRSKVSLCWVHDVSCGSSLTHERALKIDRFLVLTNWHKDFFLKTYPYVDNSQIIVTRNGIDLDKFRDISGDVRRTRNPHRAVYSSSPDRGMEVAVRVWPRIRELVPDAELHVFYGFDVWEACSKGNQGQLNLIQKLKNLLNDNKNNGVIYHGRVDQKTLANEYLQSGVWPYSTWFTETSCISAMEAQAAGLSIVTSPIAALCETVGDRGVLINGDWLSQEYQDKFVNEVVKAMTETTDDQRQKLRYYAFKNFGWDSLSDDWDVMLNNLIKEMEHSIVPKYKASI